MFQELLSMPVVASEHGQDVDNFIIYIHWLMGALFIGWTSYYLYALFRFRGSKNKKADYVGSRSHATRVLPLRQRPYRTCTNRARGPWFVTTWSRPAGGGPHAWLLRGEARCAKT